MTRSPEPVPVFAVSTASRTGRSRRSAQLAPAAALDADPAAGGPGPRRGSRRRGGQATPQAGNRIPPMSGQGPTRDRPLCAILKARFPGGPGRAADSPRSCGYSETRRNGPRSSQRPQEPRDGQAIPSPYPTGDRHRTATARGQATTFPATPRHTPAFAALLSLQAKAKRHLRALRARV